MANAKLAVIGGSGLYDIDDLKTIERITPKTPFGAVSDEILIGTFDGKNNIAFLPRHGRGHRILPTEVNSRANIFALKSIGVETILSVSAVGSLKEEIPPRDMIVPDQIIDRTKSRDNSFFGEGCAGHVAFADPFCSQTAQLIVEKCETAGIPVHKGGIYVCMEGPLFSTRAESRLYQSWGACCIGMTALPEAKLAREAEICYATLAMATDYDCWRQDDDVSIEMIIENMKANVENSKALIKAIAEARFTEPARFENCACRKAAEFAIMTDRSQIPVETKKKLDILFGKYF